MENRAPKPMWLYKLKNSLMTDIVLAFLAILSIGLLLFELSVSLTGQEIRFIHRVDLAIAFIFLSDFVVGLYLADSKKRYFRDHWTDLLASIPVTEGVFRTLRALRLLRVVRIVSVIAGPRSGIDHGARYIYLFVLTFIIILASAIFFFDAEQAANSSVNVFFDALWWTISTMTGTGESGIVPATGMGRLIGGLSMLFGVVLIGTVAGLVGHYFFDQSDKRE